MAIVGDSRGALDGFFGQLSESASGLLKGVSDAGGVILGNWAESQFKEQETSPIDEPTYVRPVNPERQNKDYSNDVDKKTLIYAGVGVGIAVVLMLLIK